MDASLPTGDVAACADLLQTVISDFFALHEEYQGADFKQAALAKAGVTLAAQWAATDAALNANPLDPAAQQQERDEVS
jgi:hypothetical protein